MKRIIFVSLLIIFQLSAAYCQISISDVLQMVEENNKELQANIQLAQSQKLEDKTENNLQDPSVSYAHQYGNKDGLGIQGELVASQSFDFPTLYGQRNKLSKTKAESYDLQHAELRQQLLLNAKEICLDLIWLNQQKKLLTERLDNAERLSKLYARRLEAGDANILETNKIDLELLNVRTEARRNNADIVQKQKELASLNGGIPVDFVQTAYDYQDGLISLDELYAETLAGNPQLLALRSEQAVAKQTISVNKSRWLPELEVGYRLNTAAGGERFNGFIVGMSIPLFSNKHQVKKAKAASLYSELKYEDASTKVENELLQLYNQSVILKESLDEYSRLLKEQNNMSLLNKALEAGQISMIEYFVEVSSLYDSMTNFMQIENDYQKVTARLLRHRL